MQHRIEIKPEYALLDVTLEPGERLIAESGAMVGMDAHVDLKAQSRGGMLKGIRRKLLGGESFFQTTFTGAGRPGRVLLAPGSPGDIEERVLAVGQSILLQSSAFLACTDGVSLDTKWGGAKGFFSGAGMFLLKATGPGTLWFSSFGALHAVQVTGEYVVDTGHIVAFQETLTYSISKVGGLKGLLFGGEGLVARFSGAGSLWIQTRNPASFAAFLNPFRPVEKN
ncbi:MAG: TIGR00266 family protein [Deltaproteobacteria bacterium]|nr:TIGR00266 family protein [Deltaproteobacteria bacterium]